MSIKTPYLSVDGIIKVFDAYGGFRGIVLIERRNFPFGLALPGGFVEVGERTEEALVREMREETSLDVKITRLLGVYSDPGRDPRFHTASIVYICSAIGEPRGQDDAKSASIYRLEEIPLDRLVFDHQKILKDFLAG